MSTGHAASATLSVQKCYTGVGSTMHFSFEAAHKYYDTNTPGSKEGLRGWYNEGLAGGDDPLLAPDMLAENTIVPDMLLDSGRGSSSSAKPLEVGARTDRNPEPSARASTFCCTPAPRLTFLLRALPPMHTNDAGAY